jgi:V/A-type H+-transporting ATPase subunit E
MEFEQLLDLSLNKIKEEIEEELKKGLNESLRILEDGYNKVLENYTQRIHELIAKTKEEIEGEKARLEVENKRIILAEKEYWINKVYEEVLNKIKDIVKTNEYKEAIKNILTREIKEENEKVLIYCSEDDKSFIEKLLGKNGNVSVKVDEKLIGGIRIYYENSGLTKDFSLKLILDQVFDNMRGRISDILFGGV